MKKMMIFSLFIALCTLLGNCSDGYDDSALWKDIDGMYKDLHALQDQTVVMQAQLEALSALAGGGVLTGIECDADGHYRIRYKGADNVEHTFDVVTSDEIDPQPVIGMQEEKGVMYWTVTTGGKTSFLLDTDGSKIPVTGRTPEIGVDAEGYWTLFGRRITDAQGRPVKAEGKSASVITAVTVNDDGTVTFALGNGVEVTVRLQNGFNISFDVGTDTVVNDPAVPFVIRYTLTGESPTATVTVEKAESLTAEVDTEARTITVTFAPDFDEGRMIVMYYDGAENVILKPLRFTTMVGEPTGIRTADDLRAFAAAVNSGRSVAKYILDGRVQLLADLDLSDTAWSGCMIGGTVTGSTTKANTAVTYTGDGHAFNRIFDGCGHTIRLGAQHFSLTDGNLSHGLFAMVGPEGEIRNLTVEGTLTVTGAAPQGALIGGIAGYCEGRLTACTNKAAIAFAGEVAENISVRLGGVAGYCSHAAVNACVNAGTLTCGKVANTATGANSGFHQGGIAGSMADSEFTGCINDGGLSAPTGRGGGILGVAVSGTVSACTNNGTVQDDVENFFGAEPGYKRLGGIAGGTGTAALITGCTNNGSLFSQLGCRTGGFVGHNEGTVTRCENRGIVLSDYTVNGTAYHGGGWAAGYNKAAELITDCVIGGKVGDWSAYKSKPADAPAATYGNAVVHGKFDAMLNGLNDRDEQFYEWTVTDEAELGPGVTYTKYKLTHHASSIYVLTVDLTNPKTVIETVMSDEIAPNPNPGPNNGKNIRETVSETCKRRIAEGRNIVAGTNSGFFDTTNGVLRGFHIEYGEPLFVNNPHVREKLPNHRPGFTLFEDRTVSFDNRKFEGKLRYKGAEYEYYSINDTVVALEYTNGYDANIYTRRFKREPHPGLYNRVGEKALFIVAKGEKPLTVNTGWIDATVTAVADGTAGAPIEVPFVTGRDEWVLQLTGAKATAFAGVKAGDAISIRADVWAGSVAKPIIMQNSSMFRFLNNGEWDNVTSTDVKPATVIGANREGNVVKLVCVDGTASNGTGMSYYQLYRTMAKLGMYNAVRFDGGGSTSMWIKEKELVCKSCDSKGDERSCMNYIHIRILE